jgi:hypothetical protein
MPRTAARHALQVEAEKLRARIESLQSPTLIENAWNACHRAVALIELGLGERAAQESAALASPAKPRVVRKTSA